MDEDSAKIAGANGQGNEDVSIRTMEVVENSLPVSNAKTHPLPVDVPSKSCGKPCFCGLGCAKNEGHDGIHRCIA